MERLTKKQKEILRYLKGFHEGKPYSKVTEKFGYAGIGIEIKILVENGLIELYHKGEPYRAKGSRYLAGALLMVTPKGREKLRETFITRVWDTAWKNPWAAIAVIVALFLGIPNLYLYSENINLQKQIKQEGELKQNMPPTVWLTQEFRNGSSGELEIIPTLHFKKNSDRLITISYYGVNFTLNGQQAGRGGGYESKFKNEGIDEGEMVFPSVYPPSIREYDFFHSKNELIIDYVFEIKDMDSQYVYRGNVTTEINSSVFCSTCPNSGYEPIIFNWTKV